MLGYSMSYRVALAWQLGAAILAAVIFPSGIVERRWAGVIAGAGFVLVSAGIGGLAWAGRLGRERRVDLMVGLGALGVLFGVSLPMLGQRLLNWDEGFTELRIWGLDGPQFHRLATWGYLGWMLIVGAQWARESFKLGRGGGGEPAE